MSDAHPSAATAPPDQPPRGRNYWPWGIAGMLLTVVVVNVIMVTIAQSTPPILESNDAYEAAERHDAVLAERAAAAALGWRAEVRQGADGVWWTLRDAQGAPVAGLAGALSLERGDTRRHDVVLPFEELRPGAYFAAWRGAPGQYRARVELERGAQRWIAARSMSLK